MASEVSGTPIGSSDLLIAARAYATGATIVTANADEFKRLRGLKAENWLRKITPGPHADERCQPAVSFRGSMKHRMCHARRPQNRTDPVEPWETREGAFGGAGWLQVRVFGVVARCEGRVSLRSYLASNTAARWVRRVT
jgi:hypothetical protein